jgi:hypothetical protein
MRPCHSSSCTHQTDLLSALYRITCRDERLAQMEVTCHDTSTMIDVNHIAGEKELIDKGNYSAICRSYWFACGTAKIDAEVPACQGAVEHPATSEPACHG